MGVHEKPYKLNPQGTLRGLGPASYTAQFPTPLQAWGSVSLSLWNCPERAACLSAALRGNKGHGVWSRSLGTP